MLFPKCESIRSLARQEKPGQQSGHGQQPEADEQRQGHAVHIGLVGGSVKGVGPGRRPTRNGVCAGGAGPGGRRGRAGQPANCAG
jgi:hypothetical protein